MTEAICTIVVDIQCHSVHPRSHNGARGPELKATPKDGAK